jgi:hypothetical protein
LAVKLDLPPGSNVSIRLETRGGAGRRGGEGRRYFFNVTGGRIECRVGSQWGPNCA